jgi:uncharacterized membrane protein
MTMQATAVPASGTGIFRMGDVLSRSISVFSQNFFLYFAIFLSTGIPVAVVIAVLGVNVNPMLTTPMTGARSGNSLVPALGAGLFIIVLLLLLAQTVIMHLAFQKMSGRPANFGTSLRHAFTRFLPTIGTLLWAAVIIFLWSLLLIIPGIIVGFGMVVAIQACLIEDLGPMAAVRRSRELTKGHRWTIFGIYLVFSVVNGIVLAIFQMITLRVFGPMVSSFVYGLLSLAVQSYVPVLAVAIYHDLRVAKDGIGPGNFAAVFD